VSATILGALLGLRHPVTVCTRSAQRNP
jgi:hypothetical protein